jgi:circadian clock protein KaiB
MGANGAADAIWRLRLYVTGQTSRSLAAFTNLKALCERYLSGRYEIELIDLLEQPSLAYDNQILATPTVVRQQPLPVRKVIGDLSDSERALAGLELPRA